MNMLSLSLLGSVQIHYSQHPSSKLQSSNAQALLFYLVVERVLGKDSHNRQALMALLWPDTLLQSAQNSLRQTIYLLRKAIPVIADQSGNTVPLLLSDRNTIEFNPRGNIDLDLEKFLRLANSSDPTQQDRAVKLYRGDFLSDFSLPSSNPFEFWAEQCREKFRRTMLAILSNLSNHALQQAIYNEIEQYSRRILEIDDLDEQANHQLMLALSINRRDHEALQLYGAYSRRLYAELGQQPSDQITTLVEAIRRGDKESLAIAASSFIHTFPSEEPGISTHPIASLTGNLTETPHNLPQPTTTFIGRQVELRALNDLLIDPRTRLVTIIGLGGIGKTRLALETARNQVALHVFQDGIFFVPLSGVGESERILFVIAEALRLRLQLGEIQLLKFLKSKQMLLVLDNFEHLLEGADLVIQILQAAPRVQILVTSRERLNLKGEQVFPLHGFPVDEEEMMQDSRHLFQQAARRIRPDFQLLPSDLPALNQICRLVVGMPLALELAAAWVDVLSLDDIVVEIQRSFDILEVDWRDIPDRHHSIQAVFEGTWQNLTPGNQQYLAKISVFQNGFSRQAAEAVTGTTLRDLSVLVNKSLLSFDPSSNRYTMHELLRQFSAAKLPQEEGVKDRHSTYYCTWMLGQGKRLVEGEQEEAASQIEKDMDNIRTAIQHALRSSKFDDLDRIINSLYRYYVVQSHQQEGVLFMDHILSQLEANPRTPVRILFWAMAWKTNLLGILLRDSEALILLPRCRKLLSFLVENSEDSREEQAFLTFIEGYRLYFKEPEKSRQILHQCYELLVETNDRWMQGYCLQGIARASRNLWDLNEAQENAEKSLAIFQALNNQTAISGTQRLIGTLLGIAGQYTEAEHWLNEGISTARKMNQELALIIDGGLNKLQMIYFHSGRFEAATSPNKEYQDLSEKYDHRLGILVGKISQGQLCLHLGKYLEASKHCQEITQHSNEIDHPNFLYQAFLLLIQIEIALGDIEMARRRMEETIQHEPSQMVWNSRYVAGVALYKSLLAGMDGQLKSGWQHLREELDFTIQHHNPLNLANCLAIAAFLKAKQADNSSAVMLYELAKQHPFIANSRWFADVIENEIERAAQELPPDTVQAARLSARDLDDWEMAETFLQEIAT